MPVTKLESVRLGYLPLLDSAVLLVAAKLGIAEERGLDLTLFRETSWATIRDRMGVGQFDAAHMLAPMPIAANLGIGPLAVPMIAPMVLALGGNAVTVSTALARAMADTAGDDPDGPAAAGAALKSVLGRRAQAGRSHARLAVVHRYSSHNYDLRYWLAASGIEPDRDVEITVVPPSLVPDALAAGEIDGFCVGEPWSTVAVRRGVGRIVTSKAEIWRRGPEKVLGVSAAFARDRPETLSRLIDALGQAALWCADPANHRALADLLALPQHLGVPSDDLMAGITGRMEVAPGRFRAIEGFMIFAGGDANRPDRSHGRWLYRQMARWGDVRFCETGLAIAGRTFRPDLFDEARGDPKPTAAQDEDADEDGPSSITDRPAGLFDAETGDPHET
ncbi:CmpA/NrtA family ABC transporter substrate-binding protein [Aurantimonas coralicida]|uniref:CmpA/NrtA family ABC transporter substrate-binding protein n=1 Tax=Aurantimonas coralicida TaxID=182270 RepID=UPI00146B240A|nr:CmpA/NrtA family ABC transporter substrate-binding protein [Aurantimonas coralicida]MCW7545934.1 ABC transporter substrate-binding protein [Aurantimonas litoralis]